LYGGSGPVLGLPLLKGAGCDANSFRYLNGYWIHRRPFLHSMEPPVSYLSSEPSIGLLQRTLDDSACADKLSALLTRLAVSTVIIHDDVPCALTNVQRECVEDALGEPEFVGQHLRWWKIK